MDTITYLLEGLWVAIQLFLWTLLFSLPLGLLVAVGRMSKVKIVRWVVRLYQLIMRGTPLMLQLMLFYYGPYYLFRVNFWGDRFIAAVVAFSLNYAAYFAEIYRGGIESIPLGQYEAGKVLGFTGSQTFFRIILPQTIKRMLPACSNEFMTLIKDTALAQTIAISELLRNAGVVAARDFTIVPFLAAGAFYLIVNVVIEQGFYRAEKKLSYYQ